MDPVLDAKPPRRRPGRPRQDQPTRAYLARQEEIIDVAISVFRERGYDSGTLEDVAATLGNTRANLYHYVPSKAHLLYLIFDRAITTALGTLEAIRSVADPERRLRMLIEQQVRIIAANQEMFLVFFGDRPALEARYESEIVAKERRYLKILIEAIKDAGAAGVIPATDPRLAAQAILGMTTWIHKWYAPQRDDPEAFAAVCVDLLLRKRRSPAKIAAGRKR
ncbi:MAG: TetR/AcrR family transcriptional regulator [Alphaproteobacteria bacterium]|nr:TetR/AcrR family transcriptional regulator [Alphaproteobacteria bacterium]